MDYFSNGQPWLMAADAIFLVPGWESSAGTKKEVDTATRLGIPIFDNISEMKAHFKGHTTVEEKENVKEN